MDGKAPPPEAKCHVITTTRANWVGVGGGLFFSLFNSDPCRMIVSESMRPYDSWGPFHVEIAYIRPSFISWCSVSMGHPSPLSKVQPNPTPSLSFRIDFYRRPGLQGFRGRMCVQKLAIIALPLCRIPSKCSPFGHEQTNRPTSLTNRPSQHNTTQKRRNNMLLTPMVAKCERGGKLSQ